MLCTRKRDRLNVRVFEMDFLIGEKGKKVTLEVLTDVDSFFLLTNQNFMTIKLLFVLYYRDTFFFESVIKTRKTAIYLRTRLKLIFLRGDVLVMLKFVAKTITSCRVKIRPITDHKFFKLWGKKSTCTFFTWLDGTFKIHTCIFHTTYVIKYKVTLSLIV